MLHGNNPRNETAIMARVWHSLARRAMLRVRWLTFKHKTENIALVMSLKYTPVTQSILCLTFSMYVRKTQCLNYSRQEPKINLRFMIQTYLWIWNKINSDTPVTLKQGQGHQSWYELVDSKQVSMKKPRIVFVKSENISINLPWTYVKVKKVVSSWPVWCTTVLQSFNLIR